MTHSRSHRSGWQDACYLAILLETLDSTLDWQTSLSYLNVVLFFRFRLKCWPFSVWNAVTGRTVLDPRLKSVQYLFNTLSGFNFRTSSLKNRHMTKLWRMRPPAPCKERWSLARGSWKIFGKQNMISGHDLVAKPIMTPSIHLSVSLSIHSFIYLAI